MKGWKYLIMFLTGANTYLLADPLYIAQELCQPYGYSIVGAHVLNQNDNFLVSLWPEEQCTRYDISDDEAQRLLSEGGPEVRDFLWTKEHGFQHLSDITESWLILGGIITASNNQIIVLGCDRRKLLTFNQPRWGYYILKPATVQLK